MVFTLHKFKHYLLGNKFVFYVNHMALVYLINTLQVSRKITRWLLLFLEYDFIVVYKPNKIHVVANALWRLLDITEPTCVFDQTINVSLFYTKPEWLKNAKEFFRTWQIKGMLSVHQKQVLVKRG
jgi:hypothetical protein